MHRECKRWRKPKSTRDREKSERCRQNAKAYWEKRKNEELLIAAESNNSNNTTEKIIEQPATSEKKLSMFDTYEEVSEDKDNQYILVQSSVLNNLLSECYCVYCKNVTAVTVKKKLNKGLAVLLQVVCNTCSKVIKETFTSEQMSEKKNSAFDVNRRFVNSFIKIGAGHSALTEFCASMKLDGISNKAYYDHIKGIKTEAQELKNSVLKKSREAVKIAHKSLAAMDSEQSESSEVIELLCSFDGSWQKRGHTSAYGLGCVIDVLTGLVVDYEVMSKYCHLCTRAASDLDPDSPEFHFWQEDHIKSGDCSINFNGSSGAMEVKSAEVLWLRSEKECGFRYTSLLSDGDAKTFKHLQQLKVYDKPITKEECVNHVAKRLTRALTDLIITCRGQGVTLGGRKSGALTSQVITKLSGYYRNSIIKNASNVSAMQQDILATLSHCSSSDTEHDHSKCPVGKSSWCFYNRALARGADPPSHEKMQLKINKEVLKHVTPIYQRLTSIELLQRCTKGLTQNPNESLHSIIWRKCPKITFVSKGKIDFAAANGVAEFNMGKLEAAVTLASIRNEVVSTVSAKVLNAKDSIRKRHSALKREPASKKRRIDIKLRRKNKNSINKSNEISYGAGLF